MRVLVVGGSGLVGTLTLPHLVERHQVRVFDLRPPQAEVEFFEGNLRDQEAIRAAVQDMDAVVFMAMGQKFNWSDLYNAPSQFDVSVTGLHSVLSAAFDAGIRHAVYTSSMSVFHNSDETGDITAPYPDESVAPNATWPYGLAKRLGEEVCKAFAVQGMRVVALRLCYPTPESEWPVPAERWPRKAIIATSGRDTASAILRGLEFSGHGFEAFSISGDASNRIVSIAKARDVLGWHPLDPTP